MEISLKTHHPGSSEFQGLSPTLRGFETIGKFNYAHWLESDGHCLCWKKLIMSIQRLPAGERLVTWIVLVSSWIMSRFSMFDLARTFCFQSHGLATKINFRDWNINLIALIVLFLSLHVTKRITIFIRHLAVECVARCITKLYAASHHHVNSISHVSFSLEYVHFQLFWWIRKYFTNLQTWLNPAFSVYITELFDALYVDFNWMMWW